MTEIRDSVIFITGANRGLGEAFVREALRRGALKVYAAARAPRIWDDDRVVGIRLDVTDFDTIADVALVCDDVTVLINNAGIYYPNDQITGDSFADIRTMFETNFFGPVALGRAFAPVLARNGGGAILDVHSVLSWLATDGAYSAAKAALWSATNSFRLELSNQGTQVLGLHLGYTDTDMIRHLNVPKNAPAQVAAQALDGLEHGRFEVLADKITIDTKAALSGPIEDLYRELAHR